MRSGHRRWGRSTRSSGGRLHFTTLPAVVKVVQHGYKLAGTLLIACRGWMIVPTSIGIRGHVAPLVGYVLYEAVNVAMMVARCRAQVVSMPIAAIGGKNVVEVEHDHIVVLVIREPLLDQPCIESTSVGGILGVLHGWRRDHHEQLILPRLEVL